MSLKEIQTRIGTLEQINTDIQARLDLIETGQCTNDKDELVKLSPQIKKYFENLECIKIVYRDLSDVDRVAYRKTFKTYKRQYISILNRIKEASNRSNREQLFEKKTHHNKAHQNEDDSTEDAYIKQGEDLLDANKQILTDTLGRVHEARQIGERDVDTLRAQNDQLERMDDALQQMETSMDVSKKIIRRLAIQFISDKVLWVMVLLIIAAVIVLIIANRLT